MSRSFVLAIFVLLAASRGALAQTSPVLPRYNVANQHTYAMTPAGRTWQTARTWSRTLGGHLVAINNVDENLFLGAVYGGLWSPVFWIGLTDEVAEGTFLWDSGEPVTFTGWCAGEPNDFGNNE